MPHNKFKSFFKGALDVSPIKPFNFKFWQKSSAKKNNNLKADTVVNLDFNINVQVQESTPNVDPDESRDNLKESWNFPDQRIVELKKSLKNGQKIQEKNQNNLDTKF